MADNIYFELGFLKLKGKDGQLHSLACEEITVQVQNENTARYACDIVAPIDIAPQKKKFTFTIKKPKFFESDLLFIYSVYTTDFDLRLYRLVNQYDISQKQNQKKTEKISKRRSSGAYVNTGTELNRDGGAAKIGDYYIEHVMTLNHCVIDSAQFGNFDGTKPVTEEIQGQARYITFSQNVSGYYKKTIQGDEL